MRCLKTRAPHRAGVLLHLRQQWVGSLAVQQRAWTPQADGAIRQTASQDAILRAGPGAQAQDACARGARSSIVLPVKGPIHSVQCPKRVGESAQARGRCRAACPPPRQTHSRTKIPAQSRVMSVNPVLMSCIRAAVLPWRTSSTEFVLNVGSMAPATVPAASKPPAAGHHATVAERSKVLSIAGIAARTGARLTAASSSSRSPCRVRNCAARCTADNPSTPVGVCGSLPTRRCYYYPRCTARVADAAACTCGRCKTDTSASVAALDTQSQAAGADEA